MGKSPEDRKAPIVGSTEWLRYMMAGSEPIEPDAPIPSPTLRKKDSFISSFTKRRGIGIVLTATVLISLLASRVPDNLFETSPSPEWPAGPSLESNGECIIFEAHSQE